jgi:uncharacterized membrane protein (DUF106 family)
VEYLAAMTTDNNNNKNRIFNNAHIDRLFLYFAIAIICMGVIVGLVFVIQHYKIMDIQSEMLKIVNHDIKQNQKTLNEILELQKLEQKKQIQ